MREPAWQQVLIVCNGGKQALTLPSSGGRGEAIRLPGTRNEERKPRHFVPIRRIPAETAKAQTGETGSNGVKPVNNCDKRVPEVPILARPRSNGNQQIKNCDNR
jgi:hypothetical protein